MGKNSETCQDPNKVIFNFSNYSYGSWIMKNQSYEKGEILLFHQKLLRMQYFYYLLKSYLEKLPVWILVILIKNVVKSRLQKSV